MSDKKIAKIYYDARVFLTKTGELYGYTIQSNGKPRCDRLSAQQKIAFWEGAVFMKSEVLPLGARLPMPPDRCSVRK